MMAADIPRDDGPPHSREAEQGILGAILIDNQAWSRVRDTISAADLYAEDHRAIWSGIERVLHDDQVADPVNVATVLRAAGELDNVGGLRYLQELQGCGFNTANVKHYARVVAKCAMQRRLAAGLEKLRSDALSQDADLSALRQSGEEMLAGISPERSLAGIDLVALSSREPESPAMVMPGIPAGCATLIAAHGGAGKSTISLFQAVCLAAGVDFFGLEIRERRKVVFLSCEDRENVLHWRLSKICAFLGMGMHDLAGWLHLVDMVGRDCIMWQGDRGGGGATMPAYLEVSALVRQVGAEVLYVDGISDTFSGNENDRGHAKQYVNALLGIVPPSGALVLIGHVPKSTTKKLDNEGYSGSTGWHNAVRARWFLQADERPSLDGESPGSDGGLLLDLQKANHGRPISMRFAWDESAHLFTGEVQSAPSRFDLAHRDREEQRGILLALKAAYGVGPGEYVPAAASGPRTAFHVLSARPEFPATLKEGKAGIRRFWRQIEQMRQMRLVAEGKHRRNNGHLAVVLCITTEGERQCAECD